MKTDTLTICCETGLKPNGSLQTSSHSSTKLFCIQIEKAAKIMYVNFPFFSTFTEQGSSTSS